MKIDLAHVLPGVLLLQGIEPTLKVDAKWRLAEALVPYLRWHEDSLWMFT